MNRFHCYLIVLLLVGFGGSTAKNLAAPLNFWNYPQEKVEEYKRNGRTCGPCSFPFEHKNQSHYACFKDDKDERFQCRNKEGEYVGCPDDCPEGTVIYSLIDAVTGPDNTFVLRCHVWGSPNPTGYWRKNGEVVRVVPPEDPYLVRLKFNISLRYDKDDYGDYSCFAKNYFSSDDSAPPGESFPEIYRFRGQVLPIAPTNLKAEIVKTHATITWDYEGPEKKMYFTIFRKPGDMWGLYEYHHIPHKPYHMRHLKPGTTYSVQIQSRYDIPGRIVGYSLLSEPLNFTIPADAKVNRPINVTVTNVDYDSVELSWMYDGNLEDEDYISFGTVIEPGFRGEAQSVDSSYKKDSDKIYGLEPYTDYKLTVYSGSSGSRRYADPVYVTTLPRKAYPRHFTVDETDEFLMKLNCTAVDGAPEPEIYWEKDDQALPSVYQPKEIFNEDGSVTSILILPRIHSYYDTYKCIASNFAGEGSSKLYLRYQKPQNKYIADSMEDFVNNMKTIIFDLRKQVKELQKQNQNLGEALMEAAAATATTEMRVTEHTTDSNVKE